jgi:nucleotide-binding universal stress UspA family protein
MSVQTDQASLGTHIAALRRWSSFMTDSLPRVRPFIVLAAVDSTPMAARVERVAAVSASARAAAELHFVHVVENVGETAVTAAKLLEDGRSYLDRAASKTMQAAPVFVHLRVGKPWEQIVRVASEIWADLVVVGTHGRSGVPRLLLGSQAEEVVRKASCPVLVVRDVSYDVREAKEGRVPDGALPLDDGWGDCSPPELAARRDPCGGDGMAHRFKSGPMLIRR